MLRGVRLLLLDVVVHTALLVLFIALALLFIPVFGLFFAPALALGLCTSDAGQVGMPASWPRWPRPRYILLRLAGLFIAIPACVGLLGQPFVFFAVRIAVFAQGLLCIPHPQQQQRRGTCIEPASPKVIWPDPEAPTLEHKGQPPQPAHHAQVQAQPSPEDDARHRDTASFRRRSTATEMRYLDHDSVWEALEGDGDRVKRGDVRLLSLRWLYSLSDQEVGVLSRRQDLPEAAFLNPEDLRRIEKEAKLKFDLQGWIEDLNEFTQTGTISGVLPLIARLFRRKRNPDNLVPVVAVSYCWLEAAHPDRHGRQLRLLCSKLDNLCGGRGLLGACKDYGFSDMGVFIDWGSGYQKDPKMWRPWMSDAVLYAMSDEGLRDLSNGEQLVAERHTYEASRTDEQKAAFDRMLHNTMDIWYAHASITVVLLTVLPDELPEGFDTTRTYAIRGWTTYERCSAELAKNFNLKVALWRLVIDVADAEGGAARRLPTTPKRMAELLDTCQFTDGADKGPVLALYEKTASAVLGSSKKLDYMGLPLKIGDPWCSPALLGDALNCCPTLQKLLLKGTQLTDKGVAELVATLDDDALSALQILDVGASRFGALGVKSLCDKLCRGVAPNLQYLDLQASQQFDDTCAEALATALATGDMPPQLNAVVALGHVGTRGAKALAAALPTAGAGCRVLCNANQVGFWGQVALFRALEAKHGWDFANAIAIACNPPPMPFFLSRANSLGLRRAQESGRII